MFRSQIGFSTKFLRSVDEKTIETKQNQQMNLFDIVDS